MAIHNDLGHTGERLARLYLQQKGYRILAMNWIYRRLEIDLIASFNQTTIFVEVKSRSSVAFGQPEDFVNLQKQKKMIRAAEHYIALNKHVAEIRFDIVAILFRSQSHTINHIEDAFWSI